MTSTPRTWLSSLALPLCALALGFTSVGCKAKEKQAPAEVAEVATPPAEDKATVPAEAPPKSKFPPASEEERALAKEFIASFTKIIESSKSEGWLDLHSAAKRESLVAKDAIEQSYSAWVVGTTAVLAEIRSNDFRLEKLTNGQLLLTFDGVMVPNDPKAVYEIHMRVEEGKLKMDEN